MCSMDTFLDYPRGICHIIVLKQGLSVTIAVQNRQNVPKIGHKTILNLLEGRWNELIMASNPMQKGRRGIFYVINLSLLEKFNY